MRRLAGERRAVGSVHFDHVAVRGAHAVKPFLVQLQTAAGRHEFHRLGGPGRFLHLGDKSVGDAGGGRGVLRLIHVGLGHRHQVHTGLGEQRGRADRVGLEMQRAAPLIDLSLVDRGGSGGQRQRPGQQSGGIDWESGEVGRIGNLKLVNKRRLQIDGFRDQRGRGIHTVGRLGELGEHIKSVRGEGPHHRPLQPGLDKRVAHGDGVGVTSNGHRRHRRSDHLLLCCGGAHVRHRGHRSRRIGESQHRVLQNLLTSGFAGGEEAVDEVVIVGRGGDRLGHHESQRLGVLEHQRTGGA